MPKIAASRFLHRLNRNGFHDSICMACRLTIASAKNEPRLAKYEREHTCNPIRLYQLREDVTLINQYAIPRRSDWLPD
jgi:hypothetical protein